MLWALAGCTDKVANDWSIVVYPNPHASQFTVRFFGSNPPVVYAQLIDPQGQLMHEREVSSLAEVPLIQRYEFDFEAGSAYTVVLRDNNTVLTYATTIYAKQ